MSEAAAELWRELRALATWELGPGEWRLLDEIARQSERLDAIHEEITRSCIVVQGSTGQLRPHPLLNAEAGLRKGFLQELEGWQDRCQVHRSLSSTRRLGETGD